MAAETTNLIPNARGVMKHFIACLEQWADCPKVKCSCPDCPTLIPFWWYAGVCGPCGREDCEHGPEPPPHPAPSPQETTCKHCGLAHPWCRNPDHVYGCDCGSRYCAPPPQETRGAGALRRLDEALGEPWPSRAEQYGPDEIVDEAIKRLDMARRREKIADEQHALTLRHGPRLHSPGGGEVRGCHFVHTAKSGGRVGAECGRPEQEHCAASSTSPPDEHNDGCKPGAMVHHPFHRYPPKCRLCRQKGYSALYCDSAHGTVRP